MSKVFDPLRKKHVELTPEEQVRQWFIGYLRDTVGVPEQRMMSEVPLSLGEKPFRADIVVYARDLSVKLIVECKRQDVAMSEAVLRQALAYNLELGSPYIAITNGLKTFFFDTTDPARPKQLATLPENF